MFFITTALLDVLSLTKDDFDSHPKKMVKFFAPWCGHCKQLAPIWVEISQEYKDVEIVEVDCTVSQEVCSKYGVGGYPTLKLFLDDKVYDYDQGRNKNAIINWLDSMLKPQFEFKTEAQVKETVEQRKLNPYFVLYTPSLENPEFAEFKGKIGFQTIKADKKKLVAHRDGDAIEFAGSFTAEELKAFVDTNKLSYVPQLTQETYGSLAAKNITTLVINPTEKETIDQYVKNMTAYLKTNPKWTEHFSISYIDGQHWEKYIESFKPHTAKDYPFILIINPTEDKKYWSKLSDASVSLSDIAVNLMKQIESDVEKPKSKDEL